MKISITHKGHQYDLETSGDTMHERITNALIVIDKKTQVYFVDLDQEVQFIFYMRLFKSKNALQKN